MTKAEVKRLCDKAQWDAFDRVLHWINEQESLEIPKKELYEAVMNLRPRRVS